MENWRSARRGGLNDDAGYQRAFDGPRGELALGAFSVTVDRFRCHLLGLPSSRECRRFLAVV